MNICDTLVDGINSLGQQSLDLPAPELAALLADAKRLVAAAKAWEATIESRLVEAMKAGDSWELEIPGLGTVVRRGASSYTRWDHDLLLPRVAKVALDNRAVDGETGEVEAPEKALMRALQQCAAIGYWRVGALKALGIDPSRYAEKEQGRERIILRS